VKHLTAGEGGIVTTAMRIPGDVIRATADVVAHAFWYLLNLGGCRNPAVNDGADLQRMK
jgi:hypothetical protein